MSGPPPKPAPSVLGLPPVQFSKLYTFATPADRAKVALACVCAAASGSILPLFSLVFGSALNSLNDPTSSIVESINRLSLYFLLIAIGASVLTFLENLLIVSTTEVQLKRLREAYCKNLLRLDLAWYDSHRTGEAVARLSEASLSVGTGMEKVAAIVRYTCTLVCGLAIGFSTSWKLTLVIMACAPLFATALAVLIVTAISAEKGERAAYARAGDAAAEVFSLIRAVAAFGGERHEGRRYGVFLAAAEAAGIRKGVGIGGAVGVMLATFYMMYGISTWAGAQFIIESRAANPACYVPTVAGCFSGGTVVTTFVAVLLGALSFGQIGPLFGQLAAARAAAADLFGVIDAVPGVDSAADGGYVPPPEAAGSPLAIEFKEVTFAYPSRKATRVLEGFSLLIPAGQCVGIVGASGSGKSTLCALALRAYDVDAGEVLVGGVDVRKWNLPTLRAALGYVSQDPVLFGVSIRENIAMGVPGKLAAEVEEADIVAAATASNAHEFILSLSQGYATPAGISTSATQLSGGQRQRICIARALIRAPRALLLDEATSALDTTSERIVQGALDALAARGGKTMLVVAHRLSTLRNAHLICVMQGGKLLETGTPADLAAREGGVYRAMLAAQQVADPGEAGGSAAAAAEASLVTVPLSPPSAAASGGAAAAASATAAAAAAATEASAPASAAAAGPSLSSRIFALQMEDKWFLLLGILGSCMSGSIQPIVSIVYGGMIAVYYKSVEAVARAGRTYCSPPSSSSHLFSLTPLPLPFFPLARSPDDAVLRAQSLQYLGWFFLLAGACLVGVLCRVSVFTYLGERMTRKLRQRCFEAVTRQPAAFFDRPENSVGRLTTRLATDAALVKGASGEALGSMVEGCAAVTAAIIIAFTASWRLALVLLVAFPLLVIGGWFEFRSVAQVSRGGNKDLENAGELLSESVTAVRTVTAYGLQPRTFAVYSKALEAPLASGMRRGLVTGLGGGFQRFVLMATYSVAFYSGAQFIAQGWLSFADLIKTFLAITLAAEAVGRISSQAPDTAKAEGAARAIFDLIDEGEATPIDPFATTGAPLPPSTTPLDIVFDKVCFAYPTRRGVPVLRDFCLSIKAGQFVGVVGASGSGKSTLVLLLLRVYEVDSGCISVGGVDVRQWNLAALRSAFGLVQQEPALFADSVAYNIGYGVPSADKPACGQGVQPKETGDSTRDDEAGGGARGKGDEAKAVGDVEEGGAAGGAGSGKGAPTLAAAAQPAATFPPPAPAVIAAAQAANAAGFIEQLSDKYATYCGSRGSLLSGGQKQRVAIARALLRSPQVLLLDEATAALDSKSEEVVQAALDAVIAQGGHTRTTLCIAHRLSTLANADRIVVLDQGVVVEDGSHAALMSAGGKYRALALSQAAGLST